MISQPANTVAFIKKLSLSALLVAFCLFTVYLLGGCGKTGYPVPPENSRAFTWKEVDAKMAGRCIAFSGTLEGAYENFDGVRVELDIVSGPDDCPGCPFTAEETAEISPSKAGFSRANGTVGFSYCPQVAPAYRWRLAGISRYSRMPHATMNDRLLVVPEKKVEKSAGQAAKR
ncbi:hypothetical protein LJC46_00035 [Desulfovibrio sp. OttesenSCG-928-G15]|nr:hypothetical protein [Desulfovibrio sp. OttesenSCG-928-G15]